MKLPRRQFLHLAAGVAALPAVSRVARAQTYPSRPVRLVVGFPAGGGTDIIARLIGQWLSERLAQPFIIENRPGASSTIATEAVVHAPPDGYTLLMFDPSPSVNATFYDKLNFDFLRDIAPVASVIRIPGMVVNPSLPAKTVPQFIRAPRKINFVANRGQSWSERLRIGTRTKRNHSTAILRRAIGSSYFSRCPLLIQRPISPGSTWHRPASGVLPTLRVSCLK
jgi:tripartite-type tricarboxylate transporter receptor subunit TctC